MNFIEALETLKKGGKIKRSYWSKDDFVPYLELLDDYYIGKPSEITKSYGCFSIDDFEADDWEVVE